VEGCSAPSGPECVTDLLLPGPGPGFRAVFGRWMSGGSGAGVSGAGQGQRGLKTHQDFVLLPNLLLPCYLQGPRGCVPEHKRLQMHRLDGLMRWVGGWWKSCGTPIRAAVKATACYNS